MEQWEIELRERLQKELPEGAYELGDGVGFIALTGKQGKIESEVIFQRLIRNDSIFKPLAKRLPRKRKKWLMKFGGFEYQIQTGRTGKLKNHVKETSNSGQATMDDFTEMMNLLQKQ